MESSNAHGLPSHHREQIREPATSIAYEDEYKKINATLQVAWSTVMDQCNYYKMQSRYQKVKCLLVSWDKDCDDMHTDQEVRLLFLYGQR